MENLEVQMVDVDLQDIMASLERARDLLRVFKDFYREDLFQALKGGKSYEIEDVADRHEQYDCVLMSMDDLLEEQLRSLDTTVHNDLKRKKDLCGQNNENKAD